MKLTFNVCNSTKTYQQIVGTLYYIAIHSARFLALKAHSGDKEEDISDQGLEILPQEEDENYD